MGARRDRGPRDPWPALKSGRQVARVPEQPIAQGSARVDHQHVARRHGFELDAVLSDCPEPGSPLLDDNCFYTFVKFPTRLFLGELLERAGMYEQAIAQLQPALVFSSCNARLKIRVWLLLGRCHVALGHKVSRWYSANSLV